MAFLRPYTPEIMGFVSNWGNLFSTYDSQGHFAHPLVVSGSSAPDNLPHVVPPGGKSATRILPGELVNQPWTDANGSAPR